MNFLRNISNLQTSFVMKMGKKVKEESGKSGSKLVTNWTFQLWKGALEQEWQGNGKVGYFTKFSYGRSYCSIFQPNGGTSSFQGEMGYLLQTHRVQGWAAGWIVWILSFKSPCAIFHNLWFFLLGPSSFGKPTLAECSNMCGALWLTILQPHLIVFSLLQMIRAPL